MTQSKDHKLNPKEKMPALYGTFTSRLQRKEKKWLDVNVANMNVKLLMAQHQTYSDIYVLLMLKNIRQKKQSLEAQDIGKNTNRLTNYYSKVGA